MTFDLDILLARWFSLKLSKSSSIVKVISQNSRSQERFTRSNIVVGATWSEGFSAVCSNFVSISYSYKIGL